MKEEYQLSQDLSEEPIFLTLDPEQVMWGSLLYSAIVTLVAMVATRFL